MTPAHPSTETPTEPRATPEHARGLLVVGPAGASVCAALRASLDGWWLGDGDQGGAAPTVGKLTIIHVSPSPDEAARAELAHACERAVQSGRATTIELIVEWAHDGAFVEWISSTPGAEAQRLTPDQLSQLAPVLAAIVRRGPRPAPRADAQSPAHCTTDLITPLVMVGASVEGQLGIGLGQPMPHVTPDELAALKLPQRAVYDLLRTLAAEPGVRECLVWNTCARMEVYAWAEPDADNGELANRLRAALFPGATAQTHIAQARARDAWLHMLRTAVGLNSTMPGDAEVVEQLRAAQRMAAYTGAAGSRAEALIDEVDRVVTRVREATPWRAHMREYTHVALERALERHPSPTDRCLVVGGSTTSISVLRYLIERGIAPANITIAYRGEGRRRLVQQVRQIAGEAAMRLRLGGYDAPELRDAARNADFIFMGVDRREPVLTDAMLDGRDPGRALTVVDFNTHPSTRGLGPEVRLVDAGALSSAVEEASRDAVRDPAFHHAAVDAERAIADRVAMGP